MERVNIALLGIELDNALIALALQKNNVSTAMLTNETDYLEKRPVALHCDSKWIHFLLQHKLQDDISMMISNGLEIDNILMPINKQQVFNSGFNLKEKRLIMRSIESFINDVPIDFQLPQHLQLLLDTLKDPYLNFNKSALEKAAIYQSKSPYLLCEFNLEQELCQLFSRKAAVHGGIQVMNAKMTNVEYIDNEFVITSQFCKFSSQILVVNPSHISFLKYFNNVEALATKKTWYISKVATDSTASVFVKNIDGSRVYGNIVNGINHLISSNKSCLESFSDEISSLDVMEWESNNPRIFILPAIVSVVGLSDEYLDVAECLLAKLLVELGIEKIVNVI
eukprot:NODE_13_length_42895_cov_0.518413.p13 type:complete len:338 gc:universal NODE_13_length_42895_cov_0.518413:1128-115(-)